MRQSKYLNVILTVNAVLLAGLLWTQIASAPVLAQDAVAQVRATRAVPTIPNAAEQRKKMIDALQEIRQSADATKQLLESGQVKVQVTNLDDIRIETGG
jgi:acetamidase/formamidase